MTTMLRKTLSMKGKAKASETRADRGDSVNSTDYLKFSETDNTLGDVRDQSRTDSFYNQAASENPNFALDMFVINEDGTRSPPNEASSPTSPTQQDEGGKRRPVHSIGLIPLDGAIFAKLPDVASGAESILPMRKPQNRRQTTISGYIVKEEAEESEETFTMEKVASKVKEVNAEEYSTCGVKLSHLKSIKVPPNTSVHDFLKKQIIPLVGNQSYCSYVSSEEYKREGEEEEELVKAVADTFVVYAHKYNWADLMDALPINAQFPDRYVWLDITSLSPENLRNKADSERVISVGETRRLLREIPTVEFVILPVLHNPLSLRRTWCVFEAITAFKNKRSICVRLLPKELKLLQDRAAEGNLTVDVFENLLDGDAILFRALDKSNCISEQERNAMSGVIKSNRDVIPGGILRGFLLDEVFPNLLKHYESKPKGISPTKLVLSMANIRKTKGLAYYALGEVEDAIFNFQASIDELKNALNSQSGGADEVDLLQSLAKVYVCMGDAQKEMENVDVALSFFSKALECDVEAFGDESIVVCEDLSRVALALWQKGKYRQAKKYFEKCLEEKRKILGNSHPDVAKTLFDLASLLLERGFPDKAKPLYDEALAIQRGDALVNPTAFVRTLAQLGQWALAVKDYHRALAYTEEACKIRKRINGEDHVDTIMCESTIGLCYLGQHKYALARPVLVRVVEKRKKVLGLDHPDTALSLNHLALLLHKEKDLVGAKKLYEQCLEVRKKVFGTEDNLETAKTMSNLAFVLKELKLEGQAKGLGKKAYHIMNKLSGPDDPNTQAMKKWWGV